MLFCFAPAVKVNNQVYRAVDNRAYLGAPSCVISYDMTNIGLSGDLSAFINPKNNALMTHYGRQERLNL